MSDRIRGSVFVVEDNIDTDQIIPAKYLNLVPTIPEEYEELGSHALAGLPEGTPRFVPDGGMKTPYAVVVGGRNFGCGSSREHAPVSIGAAGAQAIVAESFARIFFRNCIATGELYPIESEARLCEILKTGDEVDVDLARGVLTVVSTGETYALRDLGAAKDVIDNGGLFDHARKTGMIPSGG